MMHVADNSGSVSSKIGCDWRGAVLKEEIVTRFAHAVADRLRQIVECATLRSNTVNCRVR
jgi:hypothetical protein